MPGRTSLNEESAMPTLEDTVDFKVATLNDLLDADVRTGVPVAADDKYKRWAFLSTGLAGMLLVALIVSLVTGGGDKGGGSKSAKELPLPPGMGKVIINVGTSLNGIGLGDTVSIYADGNVVASGGKVIKIEEIKSQYTKGPASNAVTVAIPDADVGPVNALDSSGIKPQIKPGTQPKTVTSTTAPAAGAAPTPIEPAPATTPTS
jgi:hypothetical protein